MKSHILFFGIVSTLLASTAYAGNNNGDQEPQEKKTVKPKYDFNIFKLYSIPKPKADSLKPLVAPKTKILFTNNDKRTTKIRAFTT